MDRPNWKLVLPAAAAGGFVLVGFWGLLVGPLGTAWFLSRRRKRGGAKDADDEGARLAVFMAEAAKGQIAASAGKSAGAAGVRAASSGTSATRPASPAPAPKTSTGPRPSFAELRQRVQQLSDGSVRQALAAARLVELENTRDAHAAVEAALIARRAAAKPEHAPLRVRAASRAITSCLEGGDAAMAAALFGEIVAERAALRLALEHWEPLGRALLSQGALMEAAWALHAGAVLGKDLIGAQKRLVEVAAKAADAGNPKVALKLYATLLEKYPGSQYAEFVRSNMRIEEKKLAKNSAPA